MKDLERFMTGFRSFQKDYFGPESIDFEPLKQQDGTNATCMSSA